MPNKLFLYGATLAGLLLGGCATPEVPAPQSAPESELTQKIHQADQCVQSQAYQKAYMLYSEAQKLADDLPTFQKLQLKMAHTLYKMRNFPAALGALSPMPELPGTLHDCRKLALGSKILHAMKGQPEQVEALLEVALDNRINEPGVVEFKASGYAELGRLYVEHHKNPRAIKCFLYSAQLYQMLGDERSADVCRNIAEYLK